MAFAHNTTALGRPWRPYSRVIYIHTELPTTLDPAGWNNWNNPANEKTAFYGEFGNTGPGANFLSRVSWSHQLTSAQANHFSRKTSSAAPTTGIPSPKPPASLEPSSLPSTHTF